jgi:hypothetical protein
VQAERRQVFELVMQRAVTEYRVVAGTCRCGCGHRSEFPAEVSAPLQYGPGVLAAAVYLNPPQARPGGAGRGWAAGALYRHAGA